MSNRTIIEINHDLSVNIDMRSEAFLTALLAFTASANRRTAAALAPFGFHVVETVHHSTDRKVVIEDREFPL